jgi:hypothetical protein
MRQFAPSFGICPAAVCRIIQRFGPPLVLEPARLPAEAAQRLWILNGTLILVRDRDVGASGRNYRFSANVGHRRCRHPARRRDRPTGAAQQGRRSRVARLRPAEGVTTLADGASTSAGRREPAFTTPSRHEHDSRRTTLTCPPTDFCNTL